MKFYMHQRIFSENLIKIGLILSAQWRFSEERYQACPVTLINHANPLLTKFGRQKVQFFRVRAPRKAGETRSG